MIRDAFAQCFYIPAPTLTEDNLPSQAGRVFIVTGGYTGIGLELCKILYARNGTVYVAGRSAEKGSKGIEAIKAHAPSSSGRVEFLSIDLSDLTTIKKAADDFMGREERLDVLTQNAGVMTPPSGSKSVQGHELQMGTNCLGPFLFAQFLLPVLEKTAASSPPGSVRVTWAGSLAVDVGSPSGGGVVFDKSTGAAITHSDQNTNYGQSKAGNLLLASEFARRYPFDKTKIIANCWNPGNLQSELQRHLPAIASYIIGLITYDVKFGAYTELFAGWSDEAGQPENNAKFIWPWGRFGSYRQDIAQGLLSEQEGGTGVAARFWEWCEQETKQYK